MKPNKKKILIIEDDAETCNEVKTILTSNPAYTVQCAYHGAEGLGMIQYFRPDVAIIDLMLPEIDGFEICNRINQMPLDKRPAILLLTNLAGILNKMESNWIATTGARGLLTKPVETPKLKSLLKDILGQ